MGKRHRDEDESSSSGSSDESSSSGSSSGTSSGSDSESSGASKKKLKKEKKVDKNVVEEEEKARNREATLKRSRMWQLVSSDDDEDKEEKGKKKEKKQRDKEKDHHHHHHKDKDSHSHDKGSSSSHKKRKKESKKHDKKHKKKDKKKEDKKKKKKKHHHSEKKHKSKKELPESMRGAVDLNQYGSRGLIRESDFARKKHDFEVWMDEVKGVPMLPSAKWEVMKYFRQYMEDYNTATFPSEKYYDVDKWEMDAFRKQQENERFKKMREAGTFNDEQELAAERKKEREKQEKGEVAWALSMMSKDKREAIMEQEALKAKMQAAYKAGDMKLVRQIEYQLLPDEEKQKMKRNDRPTYD